MQNKEKSETMVWLEFHNLRVLADIYREQGDEKAAKDAELRAYRLLTGAKAANS